MKTQQHICLLCTKNRILLHQRGIRYFRSVVKVTGIAIGPSHHWLKLRSCLGFAISNLLKLYLYLLSVFLWFSLYSDKNHFKNVISCSENCSCKCMIEGWLSSIRRCHWNIIQVQHSLSSYMASIIMKRAYYEVTVVQYVGSYSYLVYMCNRLSEWILQKSKGRILYYSI